MIPKPTAEREPLADIIKSEKEVKVIMEMPGISSKNHIKINAYHNSVEVYLVQIKQKESIAKRSNYQRK
jgi:HSP20 family molecular chaperone IbpA